MSLFEFVLVMTSLVLAIGVTRLLQHLAAIVRCRNTLLIDWVPLTWMIILFLAVASYWWSLWDFRDLEWTFPSFFFLFLSPTLQYVAISLLVSTDVTEHGASLAAGFEKIRSPFFLVMMTFQLMVAFDGWLFGVEPAWNSLRLVQFFIIGMYFVGAVVAKPLVQKTVALSILGIFVVANFVLRFLPGAFGPS
ncbi:MAG: hypothetical protein BMS9Abin32_178 [Gammaproteobacteria bacterium]|nr:MAG: hypothetical protein BMS9Abin32_178 [Gammaproteobacteria bacterium]